MRRLSTRVLAAPARAVGTPTRAEPQRRTFLGVLRTARGRDALFGLALVVPALVVFVVFALRPVGETVLLSFFRRDLTHPELGTPFVGLANYRRLIGLSTFWGTVGHSFLLSTASAVAQVMLGLAVALLLNQAFRLRSLLRAAVILPWAMPTVVAAFVFRWLLNASFGPVNELMRSLGVVSDPIDWLGSRALALPTVIGAHVWKGIPFVIFVFLAGLQTVPVELRDAARVDGASRRQELRYVVLPHLRYIIAITFILRFVWTFNWFDFTYLLTGGGPGNATMTLPIQVYITAFRTFQLGDASAYATMIAGTLVVLTTVWLRLAVRSR